MNIKVKVTDNKLLPTYSRKGDGARDLRAANNYLVSPGETKMVKTGFFVAIPKNFAGIVAPRSGNAHKHGIGLANDIGFIDSNYRGEVGVLIQNRGKEPFEIKKYDRIAQFFIVETPFMDFQVVDELDDTNRGDDGFGSSGNE